MHVAKIRAWLHAAWAAWHFNPVSVAAGESCGAGRLECPQEAQPSSGTHSAVLGGLSQGGQSLGFSQTACKKSMGVPKQMPVTQLDLGFVLTDLSDMLLHAL